ncbi:hypothetical protein ASF44_00675 [Pseudorhodoferax sp. Leaf274]|nr:NAD/NADP octopine/nopaline dehydrogenase family protein [Pseudorhodoferax sp. Leaf274]KQP49172.1 hypothetical protein ASF44_00675 [Pseudorhodoferax sp. Leaf274]
MTARVAIVGAGPIGCAAAAFLVRAGHAPAMWSPTAGRLRRDRDAATVACTGALQGKVEFELLDSPDRLADFPVVLVCLPANAYAAVLGPLNAGWRSGQHVVVSGALSLAPLWIAAAAMGVQVTGWATTLTTAHFQQDGLLHVNPLRSRIDMATVGAAGAASARQTCAQLFGERFVAADSLLAPALANINPIAHAAEVIPNLTRMESGEAWSLFGNFTPVVGRLAEGLDRERRAVAMAFGLELPSLQQHYARSYHVPQGPLHTMAAAIVRNGMSPNGPAVLEHRYVLEDAPFGLAFLEALGGVADVRTPVLTACLSLLAAAYARDFRADNFLLDALGIPGTAVGTLLARCAAAASPASRAR